MKLFSVSQISEIDSYTIEHEPISSINLMERAALAFCYKFIEYYRLDLKVMQSIDVYVGPGNNGGDALAIARLLSDKIKSIKVWLSVNEEMLSIDALSNLIQLDELTNVECFRIENEEDLKNPDEGSVIIDGLFGSGLNRPLSGWFKDVVCFINSLKNEIVSIDIPSGLMGEDNAKWDREAIVKADLTITFQFPKLCFLLPENAAYVGEWHLVNIGLHPDVINEKQTIYNYTLQSDIKRMLKSRKVFAHKGDFGHALLLAGSYGKMGAAVLASRACMKAGVGLLTTHVPRLGIDIIQTAVPEVMASIDRSDILISEFPQLEVFNAIGVGPGIGTKPNSQLALRELLCTVGNKPIVLDADAINILSIDSECLKHLPPNTILTPHPGEFDRLLGKSLSGFERIKKAIRFTKKYQCIMVLKGAYTVIVCPKGNCYFNSTGNAGMATAGSGDVLTGILLALLAQSYAPLDAARLAVFVHGLAGDLHVKQQSMESVTASVLVEKLGKAFYSVQQHRDQEK